MSVKIIIYVLIIPIVIWAMDSLNINQMFKKNKILQAQVLYFIVGCSLIYLFANFLFDLFNII
ncbi:MAG: DUF1146 family protein [Bacilli bacterium]